MFFCLSVAVEVNNHSPLQPFAQQWFTNRFRQKNISTSIPLASPQVTVVELVEATHSADHYPVTVLRPYRGAGEWNVTLSYQAVAPTGAWLDTGTEPFYRALVPTGTFRNCIISLITIRPTRCPDRGKNSEFFADLWFGAGLYICQIHTDKGIETLKLLRR
jgi:hypothetical protein